MATEIELKLTLPTAGQRRFLRQPILRLAASRRSQRVVSVYYDTPDLALQRHGIALRLRRQGDAWLQTVKCAGRQEGGLAARPEWEVPYSGHFDFAAIDDPAVRRFLERPKHQMALLPLFETNFHRLSWDFDGVVLTLDRGWIAAAGRRETISELEIELTSNGDLPRLFSLAEALAERQLLLPAWRSKAERGYRLATNPPATPEKAAAITNDKRLATASPDAALRAIAFACLAQMQANHAGVLAAEDMEYLHQMRVAVRRLRACLRVFAPLLPTTMTEDILPALRTLMQALGRARDLDVLEAEIVGPVMAALPDEPRLALLAGSIAERRHLARREVAQVLQAPDYGLLLIRLTARLHQPVAAASDTAAEFLKNRLRRLAGRVRRLARQTSVEDPVGLHALRIAVKRLRYALEFFLPMTERKRHRQAAHYLAEVQETLGQLNDLANAGRLLGDTAGSDAELREAVTLIAGWHGSRHSKLVARLPALLSRLWRLSKLT